MKYALLALLVCGVASSQVVRQTPSTTATTNANLTGPVTSVGNATTLVGPAAGEFTSIGTMTVQGNAFSVGSATFSIASGRTTIDRIVGKSDGVAISTGDAGEQIIETQTAALGASDAYVAIATVTPTAGVFMISGDGVLTTGGTTAASRVIFCISTGNTSCDTFTAMNTVVEDGQASALFPVNATIERAVGPRYVNISGTTPYYLVCRVTYSVAGGATCGVSNRVMQAVRIR